MKKYVFILLFFLLVTIPAEAEKCHISGKFEDIITSFNWSAEIDYNITGTRYRKIDPDKCVFEIQNQNLGLYICELDATTALYIGTDKYLNAETIQIQGYTETNKPSRATYDWAFIATSVACGNNYWSDIQDIFIEAYKKGYYYKNGVKIACGKHPDADFLWVYAIGNEN